MKSTNLRRGYARRKMMRKMGKTCDMKGAIGKTKVKETMKK